MGGVWQALATGFLRLRPSGEALVADPCLPAVWEAVELRLRYRGRRLQVQATRRRGAGRLGRRSRPTPAVRPMTGRSDPAML